MLRVVRHLLPAQIGELGDIDVSPLRGNETGTSLWRHRHTDTGAAQALRAKLPTHASFEFRRGDKWSASARQRHVDRLAGVIDERAVGHRCNILGVARYAMLAERLEHFDSEHFRAVAQG